MPLISIVNLKSCFFTPWQSVALACLIFTDSLSVLSYSSTPSLCLYCIAPNTPICSLYSDLHTYTTFFLPCVQYLVFLKKNACGQLLLWFRTQINAAYDQLVLHSLSLHLYLARDRLLLNFCCLDWNWNTVNQIYVRLFVPNSIDWIISLLKPHINLIYRAWSKNLPELSW